MDPTKPVFSLGVHVTPLGCFQKYGGKPPKWMVKIMENPIKMDDLGGKPTIFGNIHWNVGVRNHPSYPLIFDHSKRAPITLMKGS